MVARVIDQYTRALHPSILILDINFSLCSAEPWYPIVVADSLSGASWITSIDSSQCCGVSLIKYFRYPCQLLSLKPTWFTVDLVVYTIMTPLLESVQLGLSLAVEHFADGQPFPKLPFSTSYATLCQTESSCFLSTNNNHFPYTLCGCILYRRELTQIQNLSVTMDGCPANTVHCEVDASSLGVNVHVCGT